MVQFTRGLLYIDIDALKKNIRKIRGLIGEKPKIMSIVKADGYGHNALQVANAAIEAGSDFLGISTVDEGIELRKGGITVPILEMGSAFEEDITRAINYDLILTVFSAETALEISKAATLLGKLAKIHIKIDTGMVRLGFLPNDFDEIMNIAKLPNLEIVGIFSHLADSCNKNYDFTRKQFNDFLDLCNKLEAAGLNCGLRHICNSGGILYHSEMALDMVRAGIIVYGLSPDSSIDERHKLDSMGFKIAMRLYGRVTRITEIDDSISVGYSRNYYSCKKTLVATVSLGYADGISRALSNKGFVCINNEFAPIIGNICMDQMMVDVTDFKSCVKYGDIVEIFGDHIAVEHMAELAGTINYEIITCINKRVPNHFRSIDK